MKNTLRYICAPIYALAASYAVWLVVCWVDPYITKDMVILKGILGGLITVGGGFVLVMTGAICNDLKHSVWLPIGIMLFFACYMFVDTPTLLPDWGNQLKWSMYSKFPLLITYLIGIAMTWKAGYKGM